MKMAHTLKKNYCLISIKGNTAKAEDLTAYCLDMIINNPKIAKVANIWDFRDVEIIGDLSSFEDLHDDLAPVIKEHVKVAFVTNLVLTGAIMKHYTDMFRQHEFLHFETFTDMDKCRQWALDPTLR